MTIAKSKQFTKDLTKLSTLEKKIEKTLSLFEENTNHPSLHNKHIVCKKADNLYSIRVNDSYRILYFKMESYSLIDRCLSHSKYDRLTKNC
jgi:mRNA-degrading endonuclease RelE of RelBE toxin-antitoxin system